MRFRNLFLAGGSLVALVALFVTDPDGGVTDRYKLPMFAATAGTLLDLVKGLLALLLTHWSRKAFLDYKAADMHRQVENAVERGCVASALAYLGQCLLICFLLLFWSGMLHAAPASAPGQPHARSLVLLPQLRAETRTHWPELSWPAYVPGLIEHESCISLTHSRCWSPTSELRSAREQGLGLGQLTRTWRPDGSIRFDTLAELRSRHAALRELSWDTLRARPDLQIRAVVLLSRENWDAFAAVEDHWERLAFTDVAYNRGRGGVQSERRVCAMAAGCDPDRWFGHVERYCTASTRPLYGGRSACDISRHHPRDVLMSRLPKYRRAMAGVPI